MSFPRSVAGAVLLAATFGADPVAAGSATVETVNGQVMVNRGNGFQPLQGRMSVQPGDIVMTGPGSRARITYASGCRINVESSYVTTVGSGDTCAGLNKHGPHGHSPGAAQGATASAGLLGIEANGLLIGGGFAAIGAGFVAWDRFHNEDKGRPSSP